MNAKNEISPHCRACQSHHIISNEFVTCLTDDPLCWHLVVMEQNRLCFHPSREQILAQTPDIAPPPA
jgi:hypothetical protein